MLVFLRSFSRCSVAIYLALCSTKLSAATDPVLAWNAALLEAARKNDTPSVLLARNFAVLHLTIARAILSTEPDFSAATGAQSTTDDGRLLVAAWAASDVASALYPSQRVNFEKLRDGECEALYAADNLENCYQRGKEIATQILEQRRSDGIATSFSYVPKSDAGEWRRTPPFFRPPELSQWGMTVQPLVMKSADQFRPAGPPTMTSAEYANAFNETESLGGKESTTRTDEQTLIARFWSDFSYTEMPVGHWNTIARSIAESRHLTTKESARLFVLLNLALADTGSATWDAKYHYNAWRPVTAIPRADETKNTALKSDKDWLSLLNTPAHPEYPSGHSAFSGAATSILTHFFGTDALTFDVRSETLPDQHRQFESLKSCAEECGNSRIYGGIHFRFSCADGLSLGSRVGDFIWERMQATPTWEDHSTFEPTAGLEAASP